MSRPSTSGFGSQIVYGSATTSGAISFTVPAGVTSISVVVVDGGQNGTSGGNGSSSAPGGAGNPGAGGARRYLNNIPVTPGQVITGTVAGPSGATSFGSFAGWLSSVPSGDGAVGNPGQTADTLPAGGNGGSGGGASSLIDAGAVGPSVSASQTPNANGSNGANGVWPGGGGGGGGGGAGGRTPQDTGFIGTGGMGGAGTNGAIRIVWPGNLRQFPSDNTEDWSVGEAGKWDVVRTSTGTVYAVCDAKDLGWYATGTNSFNVLRSTDGGSSWVVELNTTAQGSAGAAIAIKTNNSKVGVKGNFVHFIDLSGGEWVRGFSGVQVSTETTPGGFDCNPFGVWVATDRQARQVHVSTDNGLTRSLVFTMPGSLVPQQVLWLGGQRWAVLCPQTQFMLTDDNFTTRRLVSSPGMRSIGTAATNGVGTIIAPAATNLIVRSLDNGETWANVSSPGIDPLTIACNLITKVWVMVGLDGVVLRSDDDGITFQPVASGSSAAIWGVANDQKGTWIASGASGTIIRSTI